MHETACFRAAGRPESRHGIFSFSNGPKSHRARERCQNLRYARALWLDHRGSRDFHIPEAVSLYHYHSSDPPSKKPVRTQTIHACLRWAAHHPNAGYAHRTIEDRYDRECECHDGCRSSKFRCAVAGKSFSMNCRCNIDTDDYQRWCGCFNRLKGLRDPLIRHQYFGSASYQTVNCHACFASRALAFASGELSITSIQGGPHESRFGLISSTEMNVIEKLPDACLEGEFADWLRWSGKLRNTYHRQWLFQRALGQGGGVQEFWMSSFCETRWLCTRVWVHCAECRRCHWIHSSLDWCHYRRSTVRGVLRRTHSPPDNNHSGYPRFPCCHISFSSCPYCYVAFVCHHVV